MKMNRMKYYNLIIYYMTNIKNSPFLIGGGVALGVGLLYFTYNKYQGIPNSSTGERQPSVDSDLGIGTLPETPPTSRESSIDSDISSLSKNTDEYIGGSRKKKTKKLRKSKKNKRKKLSKKNKNKK